MAGPLALALLAAALAMSAQAARPLEAGIAMVTDQAPVSFALLGSGLQVEQFREYAASYNKQYNSISELQTRFKAFQDSVELIESTNNAALTYTLGLNQFADWTWEEFQSKMLQKSQNCSATKGTHVMSNRVLPEKVDWRKKGIVSAVKSQATCGSCWAFSTVGSLEAAHAQKTGEMVLLSEQQLVDCAGDYNNFGCMGGLPSQAFEYIHYNGGLDKAEAYPYKGVDGECHFDASRVGATVKNIHNITEYNEEELIDAVAFVRPVSIAYEVAPDFRLYKNGVYSSPLCRQGPLTVNHAVVAVGFDRVGLGIPYFIVKNSWGTTWGEEGYFNIEMGKNMCGIATCASYPEV